MDHRAPTRFVRAAAAALLVSLAQFAVACDRFAGVEVNNDTEFDLHVAVNGWEGLPLVVPAGGRAYTHPGVNERLRSLKITLLTDPAESTTLEFNTFDDDIVLHVFGPPLEVEVTHADHPSATSTSSP